MENNCCTDAVGQSSDDGRLLRSSSYEDIYVGTKLPGDEPSDDKDYSFDVSDIGDRFDSRPTCAAFLKQLGRRSSSFENLYEMQKREPEFAGDRNEVEDDSESFCMQPWQIRDSSEDFGEKDYVLAPIPSLIGEAQKNFPIDITVESGLDRVGQSAGYTTKRSSSHLLQHSMSYDLDPDKRHCKISSGSSLDGNDDGIDLQREQNAASDIWNEGQLDEDNDEVEPVSVSSHSEVAQLEDITGHHSSRVVEGGGHGIEPDTRSEETDIDEPFSPSAREVGFSFSKNTSSSLSALAQSPPECLSPSKEQALKDELSPVTEVPSDIRKLKFNIGASPSDFIMEENECEDVQQSSLTKDSQEFFQPISESGESDELETVVEGTKPTAATACETVGQSLKASEFDVKHTGVLPGSREAVDSSDDEVQDFVDDGSGPDRMTLLSFDNIVYEDPTVDNDFRAADQASKQVFLDVSTEERSDKHHRRHKISISSDSDSEKLIDAEMVDIQSTLQTQFESTPASKLAESLGFDQSQKMQHVAHGAEKREHKSEVVLAEPHESIRRTHDAEVLSAIESRRSNDLTSGTKLPDLFGFLHESNLAVGDTEAGGVTDTLIVSAVPDDVMKTSTSSDASAEPMILAATYDLDLGAVSRVVATYDMSPDSVDKVFVIDKHSKVIQSSPDDEVFETEGAAKNAAKTEDSSGVAESTQAAENLDFDTNEMPFELVKADDVDGYEAYLEVMQQNRAVTDQELGALLDLHICAPDDVGKSSCDIAAESSSHAADDLQQTMSLSTTASVQPDLIQGMPWNVDIDILSNRSVHDVSVQQEDRSRVDSELITVCSDEPDNANNACAAISQISECIDNLKQCSSPRDAFNEVDAPSENVQYMPASFGKGALESDNMYQVFQQDTSNSPGDDDVLASSFKDTYFGLRSEKQADDETDEHQEEDLDDDYLAESAEPELMALSEDKDDEECNVQVNLLGGGDGCQATSAGISSSWLVVDPQCLDRPLSPLPDNAYRIVDDSDDTYVTRHMLHSSTVDSESKVDTSSKQVSVAEVDSMRTEQAVAIVSQVMSSVKAVVDVEDGAFGNQRLQDVDVDEGIFQVFPDLTRKDLQEGSSHEEVDDVDEGVLQEDEQQLCDDEDIDCSRKIYEPLQHYSQGHHFSSSEAVAENLDAADVLDLGGDCVPQKASEFVNSLVREAQVEAENVANRSQEAVDRSLTDYTAAGLCRLDEAPEEFSVEGSISSEDTVLLPHDQTESGRSEAGSNGTIFEWNGVEQTNFEDYGDSSSVDSFATVVPCHQEVIEDRMEDLASVSSSFHSDLHSSYLEDQPEPIMCLDARDEELMHGETEDSSGSEHFEAMRDDLDSSVVEMVPCYESPDEDRYAVLDDDFDHPMMMLATIKEEDERSSTSGKSGKTGSSSERVDGTSDSDKQASSVDLHADYPCRRMVGKSSDKDDVSVSSSLLEFENLEKEMQDRTSLDSLAKLGSQQSVAEKSSASSSSLLEFERIEKEMQDRTSHDSLTKLGSLQSVAEISSEKDNVSVSSSLAEFERLEREVDVNESSDNISIHATYGMVGSTTSLNAFLMDDSANLAKPVTPLSQLSDQSFGFHEQFECEARAVVSMLEAGALPVMGDHMPLNTDIESSAADVQMIPAVTDEAGHSLNAGLSVYPEYQDIVQIIRKASETAHENVEDESKQSCSRSAVHEPDVDSLNERDNDEISDDDDAVMTAEARDPGHMKDIDNSSLPDDSDSQMFAGPHDSDQVVPDGMLPMDPVERSSEDVMETSADSIEGVREETALDRSSDSLELRSSLARNAEALMHQSLDSLSAEDAPHRLRDSFDADSLHESSAVGVGNSASTSNHQTFDVFSQSSGLLIASVESGAWSQSDSLLSNTETLRSSGSSRDDNLCVSLDSPNALSSTIQTTRDNHVDSEVTTIVRTNVVSGSDEAELQASQPDSCYCHSPVSPSSSHSAFLSQKENHTEHMSGN